MTLIEAMRSQKKFRRATANSKISYQAFYSDFQQIISLNYADVLAEDWIVIEDETSSKEEKE